MANFDDRPYPWPSDQTSTVLPETGGNTRLLFAEQDNYRLRKGSASGGTAATGSSETFSDTHSNDLYRGEHAADDDVTSPVTNQYYYNTASKRFRRRSSSDWTDATSNPISTNSSRTINVIFNSSSNPEFATATAAAARLSSSADISATNTHYIFYNTTSDNVERVSAFTAGTSGSSGDIFYVIPRVVSADIAETTENIPIEFLKGSLSANKAQAGAQTYGNGFSIAASEEGLHLFLRTLTQSRKDNIKVTERSTAGSAVTVTASGGAITLTSTAISRLEVKPVGITDNEILELQFDGKDHEGTDIRELMILTSNMNGETIYTDFYFAGSSVNNQGTAATHTSVTYTVNRGAPGSTTVSYNDNYAEVTFEQPSQNDNQDLLPGWTIEVRKGTIPFTYVGVLPNEASIALARDAALQIDITTIAFDSLPYTDMAGNEVNINDGSGSRGVDIDADGTTGKGGLSFVDASETLFTGWQAYLEVTEPGTGTPVRVPLTDATFTINHQLDQAQLIVGDRRPGPPFRGALRDVMLDGTMLFTRERDWIALFRNNTDFRNPVVVLRNAQPGGFPYELRIELGIGQLMSSPDPQVGDIGLITQAFNMKFRESASGRSDDFKFIMKTDKWPAATDDTVGGLRTDGAYA